MAIMNQMAAHALFYHAVCYRNGVMTMPIDALVDATVLVCATKDLHHCYLVFGIGRLRLQAKVVRGDLSEAKLVLATTRVWSSTTNRLASCARENCQSSTFDFVVVQDVVQLLLSSDTRASFVVMKIIENFPTLSFAL